MKTKIILFLILAATIAAQDNKTEVASMRNKQSLLFSINEFRLESFNGGFGFKFWALDDFALLGKINYSYSKAERDKTAKLTGNIDENMSYGASIGIEKHISMAKNISPYIGVSFTAGFEDKNEKVNSANYLGAIYTNEQKTLSKSISVNLSFGVEYFLTESVSLAGQYNFGAVFNSGEEEYKTPYSATKMDVSDFKIGISSGALIVAVYF
ncbi:MAG: hypothetical protein NTX22_12535 [Ignavibacteriales bacterium]|nr:hypothetical protein [Ignavibacteriales bacterium]